MADENEDLAFYRPSSGFNLFIDAMCIPACAQQKEAAELFINFLCEPEIAAGNMEWICYSTPLKREAVEEFLGAEVLDDLVAYPTDEEIAKGTSYDSLPAAVSRLMESLFLKARIS
jgi:spermidine/putrescine transport system substrate-binding protein